jgi:ribosomal protein S25
MRTRNPDTGQIQEAVSPEAVLALLDELDLPFVTSKMVADEFDCSTSTARNKLADLTDQAELRQVDCSCTAGLEIYIAGLNFAGGYA